MAFGLHALRRAFRFVCWDHGGLSALLGVSLLVRMLLFRWWAAAPFGDVFNFVRIAQELAHGAYPLLEKRLPAYPLFILLVHALLPGVSWEGAAVSVALAGSLLALVAFYALGRTLGIRRVPLLVGVALLSSFQPFLALSIRGYADTTLVVLLLGSQLAALRVRSTRGLLVLGGLLGLLTLTRYEGLVASAVLLVLLVIRTRGRIGSVLPVIVVMALVLLPYAVFSARSGRNLLPVGYLARARSDSGQYGASSAREFFQRYEGVWQRLGLFQAWRAPLGIVQTAREDPFGLPRHLVDLVAEPRSATALLAIPGFLWFFWRKRRVLDGLVVTAPFFAMAVLIAWWSALVRFDAMLYPLMAMAAAAGAHVFSLTLSRATAPGRAGRAVRGAAAAGLLCTASLVWMLSFVQQTRDGLKKSRFRDLGYYQALRHVRALPGVVAFENRLGITEASFGDRAVYAEELFPAGADPPERWRALTDARVSFVVASGREASPYQFLRTGSLDVRVDEIARYVIEQGNHDINEGVVYRLTKVR